MESHATSGNSDDKTGARITTSSDAEDGALYRGRHSRPASTTADLTSISESHEVTFNESTYGLGGDSSLLREQEPAVNASSSSILRRITNKLAPPRFGSQSYRTPPIPMSSIRSTRRPQGPEYANIQDVDEGDHDVSVDLSTLAGLGFEVTECNPTEPSRPWLDEDTTYQSPQSPSPKPDFQSFVRRKQLGDGLRNVGAQLRRDPTRLHKSLSNADEIRRNRTARNKIQNYAQERNVIVAVTESVDLSVLEGPRTTNRASLTFDGMMSQRTGSLEENPQSYFFPQDPDIPDWRPMTMSRIFLIFLVIAALALAGSQEYLCQKSQQLQRQSSGLLHFDEVAKVSVGKFFVWKYLPTMVTIIYAVLFSIMDFDIRRLEPYYQLSKPQGSPASASLNVDHLTMFQYFVPFKALRLGHWTVFFSTIGNIIASTVSPALQNPSVNFTINPVCNSTNPDDIICPDVDGDEKINKYVVLITPIWSRLLTASYVVIAVTVIMLLIQLRRKSGLLSDPKGIAGIASMATKSHILRDFKRADLATREDIQKRLAHRRFVLYKSSIWQGEWSAANEPEPEGEQRLRSPHPPMLRLKAGIPFILVQVFCLIAVPLISLTPANIIPNKAPWLPILVATILKLIWSTFEADVRLMEPFYRLSLGNARPENSLTLDYQATIYGFMPFKAAYNGHWLLCIVGIVSVALDVLSVTVSSFSVQADLFLKKGQNPLTSSQDPDSDVSVGDQTKVSFWASVVLSIVILSFSISATILVYVCRRHPFLPREPSTIASILGFIYASNMLEDFIDTELYTNKQMEARLKKLNKRYALGWFRGRDNQIHCAIDQEPMRSKYVHGKPYDQALAMPSAAHETYYSMA